MSARLKAEFLRARNKEFTFHVIRGSRIILTPGETYDKHSGARRAMTRLAEISAGSPLAAACLLALELDKPQKKH